MTLSDPNLAFKITVYLQIEYLKTVSLGTKLLKNANRKPYTIYRMKPLSMTLLDLWPQFQGHDIFFDIEYLRNDTRWSYIVTMERQ